MKKALIAMSGGVDSSLAAKLMKDRGFDCIGCTMKLYYNEDAGIECSRTCCSLDDVEDARSVAYKLGMPFYVFNFTDVFRETVISKFIESYEKGATQGTVPCVVDVIDEIPYLLCISLLSPLLITISNLLIRNVITKKQQ